MKQIKEAYVSFETAKLLKEKGFDYKEVKTFLYPHKFVLAYKQDIQEKEPILRCDLERGSHKGEYDTEFVLAITQQMAVAWLRENYNLIIVVYPAVTDDEGSGGCLWKFSISLRLETKYISKFVYTNPEIAIDTAINYCLENLI